MFTFEIKLKMCIVVISNLNRIALWEVKVLSTRPKYVGNQRAREKMKIKLAQPF